MSAANTGSPETTFAIEWIRLIDMVQLMENRLLAGMSIMLSGEVSTDFENSLWKCWIFIDMHLV